MRQITVIFLILLCLVCETSILKAQNYRWAIPVESQKKSRALSLGVDQSGAVYTLTTLGKNPMSIFSTYSSGDLVLSKYDSNGTTLWRNEFIGNACGFDLVIDSEQNIIIAGAFFDSLFLGTHILHRNASGAATFIAKISAEGNILWANQDTSGFSQVGFSLATDKRGATYVGGLRNDIENLLIKFNAKGEKIWQKHFEGVRLIDGVATDTSGNLYASGTCFPEAQFDTFRVPKDSGTTGYVSFVIKCDSSGKVQWLLADRYFTFWIANSISFNSFQHLSRYRISNSLDGNIIEEIYPDSGIVVDSRFIPLSGFVQEQYLSNTMIASIAGTLTSSFFSGTSHDTARIYSTGYNVTPDKYYFRMDKLSQLQAAGITIDALASTRNAIYITGSYADAELHLGSHVLMNPSSTNLFQREAFLTRLDLDSPLAEVPINKRKKVNDIIIYPSPSRNFITILPDFKEGNVVVKIENLIGQTCYESTISQNEMIIDISSLPSGSYKVTVRTSKGIHFGKFIKN